jgi:hypothetical protein
MAMIFVTRTF